MFFSQKQKEFLNYATHRWNVKTGATRSGKTYMDYYLIPMRIRQCIGSGLIMLIGNTKNTLVRNILDPMREIWGSKLVGNSGSNNTVQLFGKKCHLLGADKVSQVEKLQGSGLEYCYGDEVTTWNEEVFNMLKSRLDKPNSIFDGTCNPDNPNHWFKVFLDQDLDIYQQSYTIDDNPFADPTFVANLKKEYAGTVYYDRFILGKWQAAEGVIYRIFADNPERFLAKEPFGEPMRILLGVDFGGTKSGTSFVATAILPAYAKVIVLSSERHTGDIDPSRLGELFVEFVMKIISRYGRADYAYCDSAESILIRGLRKAAAEAGLPVQVHLARKIEINDRIRLTSRLLAQDRLLLTEDCKTLSDALATALWDSDEIKDVRLDDGTTDIDTLDAFEYTIERDATRLVNMG